MDWLINLAGGLFGGKKLWAMLDGMKLYLTGVATMLTGAAGLIQEYVAIAGAHNLATLWAFVQGFPKDTNYGMILAGFGIIAAAHKAQKVIDAVNTPISDDKTLIANGKPADAAFAQPLCATVLPPAPAPVVPPAP